MPRPRKSSTTTGSTVSLPSNGTAADISRLSSALGLSSNVVVDIMTCQGMGVRSSRSSAAEASGTDGAAMAAMSNIWGDWMSEEMTGGASAGDTAASADTAAKSEAAPAAVAPVESSGPRNYILPLEPIQSKPGLLLQTGTLDSTIPGRSSVPKQARVIDLECPTIIFSQAVEGKKFVKVVTSATSCHSVAITEDGEAYGWGRNESGQLGLGYSSPCVPVPTLLSIGTDATFVSAGVGKYHTLLVTTEGTVYASGGNKCGQLGVNNEKLEGCDKFRKCSVVDYGTEEEEGVKIIHASAGENISALISSKGHLYTAGSSEWGQLGNGETGEYIITAGKLGYANSAKFLRRDMFVESESTSLDGGRVKCTPLSDASSIRLQTVSCGRNHLIAVEAKSSGGELPRVFSWGCGDYGCLGHAVQADEYRPRMVNSFKGPIFANNHPVDCVAGANCSMVRTKNGHVYYMGKHKSNSEATMRPNLLDALANNGHVVTSIGAGSQTIFCSTANGVTVSSGHGSEGQLGFGKEENKSSSKPKFVNGLDSCIVTDLACGMGHTLFLVQNEDADDAKAIKKIPKLEESDAAQFIDQLKAKRGGGGDDGPPKKKAKGGPKKS